MTEAGDPGEAAPSSVCPGRLDVRVRVPISQETLFPGTAHLRSPAPEKGHFLEPPASSAGARRAPGRRSSLDPGEAAPSASKVPTYSIKMILTILQSRSQCPLVLNHVRLFRLRLLFLLAVLYTKKIIKKKKDKTEYFRGETARAKDEAVSRQDLVTCFLKSQVTGDTRPRRSRPCFTRGRRPRSRVDVWGLLARRGRKETSHRGRTSVSSPLRIFIDSASPRACRDAVRGGNPPSPPALRPHLRG